MSTQTAFFAPRATGVSFALWLASGFLLIGSGCLLKPAPGTHRRPSDSDTAAAPLAESPPSAEPSDGAITADPAVPDELGPPYRLDAETIVRLVFSKSPRVRAAREEMVAAQHGLEEFRANLSRLEPFVEGRSDLSEFPNRTGAFGHTAEAVVGIQKETFEGAIMRAEAGGALSRFRFDDEDSNRRVVEDGSGGLVRARFEAPFFGSRRRQNRVIAQAFQESTARRAQLDYLDDYGDYVDDALSYYGLTVVLPGAH